MAHESVRGEVTENEQRVNSPLRRKVLQVAGGTTALSTIPFSGVALGQTGTDGSREFDLLEATIADIQAAILRGDTTSEEIVTRYLKRLKEYNPLLNAIITVNPDAIGRAQELDAVLEDSEPIGPLHGVPIILKDNFDTGDMPTTAGSVLLRDSIPPDDAFTVEQLRNAGGIILAKANLHEFAAGVPGISSLGGQTLNPYALNRIPGGSSSGTGASIAANLGAVGTGSDTGGSVRIPAAYNSLVGLRPTTGLVSRDGIVPRALTQDTAGPITRTVADSAIMLDVMAGYDPDDPLTARATGEIPSEGYTSYLNINGLEGARIGVMREYIGPDRSGSEGASFESSDSSDSATDEAAAQVTAVIEEAIDDLREGGAEIVDPVPIEPLRELAADTYISPLEWKRDLNNYLDTLGPDAPDSMQEIIESGTVTPGIVDQLRQAQEVDVSELDEDVEYLQTLQDRKEIQERLYTTMANCNLDSLIYPTTYLPPAKIGEAATGFNTTLSPTSGFPAMTVPAGFTEKNDLPVGLEFLTRPFNEPLLIELGYSYEQLTQHRRPPDGFGKLDGTVPDVPAGVDVAEPKVDVDIEIESTGNDT